MRDERLSIEPPECLNRMDYRRIRFNMLDMDHDLPPALDVYDPTVSTAQFGDIGHWASHDQDHSFARQILQVCRQAAKKNIDLPSPDAFAFTANSAIPVADAVRGYYEHAGLQTPHLDYVVSNINISRLETGPMHDPYVYVPVDIDYESAELERLATSFAGKQHVCVVDQVQFTGFALRHAAELLHISGVETVSMMRGMWYHEVDPKQVNKTRVTSKHRRFMMNVGKLAARL